MNESAQVATGDGVPGHGRRKRRHGWVSGSLLLTIVGGLLVWHGWLWWSIRGHMSVLATTNQPLGLEAAMPVSLASGQVNGADDLQAAFAVFPRQDSYMGDGKVAVPFLEPTALTVQLAPEVSAAMQAALAEHAEALQLMEAGLSHRQFIFTRDFMHGYNTPLPVIQDVRRGVALFCLRAMAHGDAGEAEAALRDIRLAALLCEALRRDRSVLSFATRLSCRPLVYDVVTWCVFRRLFDAEQLVELAQMMGEFEDPTAVYDAMVVSRAQAIDAISRMGDTGETVYAQVDGQNWDRGETLRVRMMGLNRLSLLRYLEAMEGMSTAVTLPLPERLVATQEAARAFRTLPPAGVERAMVYEGQVYTGFESIQLARSRTLQAALLVLAGQEPGCAGWPLDPYSGEPVRLVRGDQRVITYSVGRNGRDDGGYGLPDPALNGEGPPLDFVCDMPMFVETK